jgi:hypothetical protein
MPLQYTALIGMLGIASVYRALEREEWQDLLFA